MLGLNYKKMIILPLTKKQTTSSRVFIGDK